MNYRIPEGKEKGKEKEWVVQETKAENFSTFWNEVATQIPDAKRVLSKTESNRKTPKYSVIKMAKIKNFRATRENTGLKYKKNYIRITKDLPYEMVQK